MRSRVQLEIAKLETSSWMPCAPQGVEGPDDDDDDDDDLFYLYFTYVIKTG
jgi:hypothetical protein